MSSSLYSLLTGRYTNDIVLTRCKRSMVGRLIRHFEDLVVENRLPALVLQGRCLDGDGDAELERFRRLSASARHHYLFSCGSSCPDRAWAAPDLPECTLLQHDDFHAVDTGPFIVVVSPKLSGLLASARVADVDDDGLAYEMAWSFDPNVVFTAIEYLNARVSAQHPAYGEALERRLRERAPVSASLRLTLDFMTKLAVLLQRQTEMETAMNRISALVNSTFDLDEILQGAVEQIARSLEVRRVALSVWSEAGQMPEAVHVATHPGRRPAASGPLGVIPEPIEVPVAAKGHVVGSLSIADNTPGRVWQEEEVTMIRTIADHLAIGISHARLFKHVSEQAITDHLTGLFNKRYFVDRLEREMDFARRSGKPVALLILDLDRMKQINDTHGHLAGDAALRHVGNTMRQTVRNVDVCARYGGEEFVVILPVADLEGAVLAAERLRVAISSTPVENVGHVTASFGLTVYPGTARTAEEFVEEADRAMYFAKASGRNCGAVFGDPVTLWEVAPEAVGSR